MKALDYALEHDVTGMKFKSLVENVDSAKA